MKDQSEGDGPVKLDTANLGRMPGSVLVPAYDRAHLTPGIVHIGLGNFHRAHQAWYLHRLMQQGKALDWAIIGAGVRANDRVMRDNLLAQDCLTTLIELDPHGGTVEIIGPMIGFLPIEDDNAALVAQMSDPAIRIVALTVTEGGYYRRSDGAFDRDHPDIQHDAQNPDRPRTAFGAMVAALKLRRSRGLKPFTGQCCDNLQQNGKVLRDTVVGLARLSDPALADWIDREASFPDSMVDCIVPATGPGELAFVQELGILDAAPVTHENYRQWVIEDDFCSGRPAWEEVGATLTKDVHLHETMKIRILNAGHQLLANVGEVLNVPTIAACMADADISAFFHKVEMNEIVPHVRAVPEMTPQAYLGLVARRFANPMIHDTTRRVAFDGSARHSGFLLPILRDGLRTGQGVEGLALAEAFWARMCAGTREDGSAIAPNDPHWDSLSATAQTARRDPQAWLRQDAIYGNLANDPHFATAFARHLAAIWRDGCRAAIRAYLA